MKKSTWSPTWRTMDKVSWSPRIFIRPTSKRWAWCKFGDNMIFLTFQDRQTPLSNSLKLVDFEIYYMKPNPPLHFRQQIMQWSHNMVHSHFILSLRVHDYLKRFPNTHGTLWMRVKGPHHYKVTALGFCVRWSLVCRESVFRCPKLPMMATKVWVQEYEFLDVFLYI